MNRDHIARPLRLVKGSYRPELGKWCAMNAISYISGDEHITDFPPTSARPLAAFVQLCNDLLAGPDGYLSPENSVLAIELGGQTIQTAGVADDVVHGWVAELLSNPVWGVVQYVENAAAAAIFDIAKLHRKLASGEMPPISAWDSADRTARAVIATLSGAGIYAVRAAYQATALLNTERSATLDAVTGNALRAHTLATGDNGAARIVELTRHAIRSWRRLSRLDDSGRIYPVSIDSASATDNCSGRNRRSSTSTASAPRQFLYPRSQRFWP
jgi:hypothetical protein